MLLKNNFSPVWVQNSMTGLFFLIVLLNWIELILILFLGIFFGGLVYLTSSNTSIIVPNSFIANIFAYIAPIGIAAMFFYAKEQKQKEKLEAMKLLGASIAHELRTPLVAIKISNENLKNVFLSLVETYRIAQKANIPIPTIREHYLKVTETAFDVISSEVKSSNNFIDMLLMNVNTAINNNLPQTGQFLIGECINKALSRYPFKEHQRKLIFVNQEIDFLVKGNQELIEHVLFNLIKNALYYIAAASKDDARIEIWLEKNTVFNKLYFKDTGTGIDPDILPHIFEQFFSRTHHGAGIGLTFCKMVMESLGGSISCESEKGNYTQFILLFPSITK